jgi:subfamily B ATP-binding cassette protein MsbA
LASLRRQIAMVSQNVVVLNDTLAHNVALGQPMDEARVLQCLQAAHLSEYLASLDQGIHTLVGHNASQLSGGQRQRLAIARALYKDAPILILDEATSALDNESERAVQQALVELQKGRTTLIIAHRLSTIEHADRIIVMEGGRIVEQGAHAALLAQQGTYAALFKLGSLAFVDSPSND